jgi:thymidylate synthase (FAD)
MRVKLITATPDIEKTAAYVARVSSPHQENPDYEKLLRYCYKHKHWSVFEHGFITLEINTSRAIARQILRHKSFAFSEFSQRYSTVTNDMVHVRARSQDLKNRQNSIDDMSDEAKVGFNLTCLNVYNIAMNAYEHALAKGVAKECARALLPEGLTPSKLYMSGSVRSYIHWLDVRCGNGTQLEHQEIALEAKEVLREVMPAIIDLI